MVRYFWSESNGTNRPTVRYMDFEPSTEYYKGMPLKKNEAGAVMPTTGEPEYICMWDYQPDGDIRTLEIPVIEIFPDTIYEKWNEDGTVEEVRFGSGGGGLPSDLVETVPDEVPLVITFDGNLEGKEYIDSGGGMYTIKYSDAILSYDEIIGTTAVFFANSIEEVVLTEENVMDGSAIGVPGFIASGLSSHDFGIFFVHENASVEGLNLTPGIWSLAIFDEDSGFTSGLKSLSNPNVLIPGGERTQIKPEFMPPHKHKWDDIEDQPFYDKSVSAPLNITFDGDLTGKEALNMGEVFVRVSDAILDYDMLVGASLVAANDVEEITAKLTAEDIMDMSSEGMPAYMIATSNGTHAICVRSEMSAEGMTIKAGVWFLCSESLGYTKSLTNPNVTITTSEIKKLDPKFYDRPCYDDIIEIPFDFVFNSNNEIVANSGMHLAKVSNVIITEESDLVGSQIYASDGRVINITSSDISKDDNVINVSFFAMCVIDDFEMATDCILTPGVWVVVTGAVTGDGVYVTRFAKPGEVLTERKLTPLPEKYMPDLNQLTMISPSGKKFKVTVDDSGKLTAVEV